MNFRNMSDADLVDFSKNVELRLADHEVTCFPNDLADSLALTIAPLNVSLETTIEGVVVAETAKQSQVATKQDLRQDLLTRLATIETYLKAVKGDKTYWELCGFNFPKERSAVVPYAPTSLAAVGTSNGVNELGWTGNNKSGSVTYQMWRRHGDEGDWYMLNTTRKQRLVDSPVTPGQYYEYKVRAAADNGTVSAWSNTAVIYGAP